jgi:hypothetical protein
MRLFTRFTVILKKIQKLRPSFFLFFFLIFSVFHYFFPASAQPGNPHLSQGLLKQPFFLWQRKEIKSEPLRLQLIKRLDLLTDYDLLEIGRVRTADRRRRYRPQIQPARVRSAHHPLTMIPVHAVATPRTPRQPAPAKETPPIVIVQVDGAILHLDRLGTRLATLSVVNKRGGRRRVATPARVLHIPSRVQVLRVVARPAAVGVVTVHYPRCFENFGRVFVHKVVVVVGCG